MAVVKQLEKIMQIKAAAFKDSPEILELQKLAYLSEAELINDYSIQPLTQTLEDLQNEFDKSIVLKLINEDSNEIIGSVRAYEENKHVYIGKLIVHPNYQNNGFGTNLLKAIETSFKNKTFELFTSSKSERNLYFYKKNGYKEYKREKISGNIFVFMEK
jgi:ribosomal protein S18 acetylase RimI-like enzyme